MSINKNKQMKSVLVTRIHHSLLSKIHTHSNKENSSEEYKMMFG